MKACVYKILNIINNKVYIGKTVKVNPYDRFNQHIKRALSKNEKRLDCPKLYNSIRHYGPENFTFEVLETFNSEQEALDAEERYIEKFNSIKTGLNIVKGGQHPIGGEHNQMFGKGYKITGEKNGMFGKCGELNPFFGKKHDSDFLIRKSQMHSKYNDEEIADIKMLLFNNVPTKQIREKYPTIGDKTLSLIRGGKRWSRILPEIKLSHRKNLTTEDAQQIYDEWKTGKYKTKIEYYNSIKDIYQISLYSIMSLLRGTSHKDVKRY
jgi:group I intron endonuclease